jgi:hypothetical protein
MIKPKTVIYLLAAILSSFLVLVGVFPWAAVLIGAATGVLLNLAILDIDGDK